MLVLGPMAQAGHQSEFCSVVVMLLGLLVNVRCVPVVVLLSHAGRRRLFSKARLVCCVCNDSSGSYKLQRSVRTSIVPSLPAARYATSVLLAGILQPSAS